MATQKNSDLGRGGASLYEGRTGGERQAELPIMFALFPRAVPSAENSWQNRPLQYIATWEKASSGVPGGVRAACRPS